MSIASYPFPRSAFTRRLVALALGLAAFASQAEEQKPSDPIIELPKFVVTDSRELPQPESWRYATLPGFEILSSASDKATQRLVSDFQMFREALDIVWPLPPKLNAPVLLILCGKERQFQAFEPKNSDGGGLIAHASVYLKGRTQSAIVINLGASVVDIVSLDLGMDALTGTDSSRLSIDHNKQLYREYVHFLLSKSEPRLPPWFEEGMAQILMAMDFNPKWIELGRLEEGNTVSAGAAANALINQASGGAASEGDDGALMPDAPAEDRDFNVALRRRALLPMDKLFGVRADAPEVVNPLGNNNWAKQAYAFVHMGLYGDKPKWQKQFSEFLIRSTQEPVTEELFKRCFKMSYKDMGLQLRSYVEGPTYVALVAKPKNGGVFLTNTKVSLREATAAEIGRIKGRAMLLAGNQDGARTELIAPYIRGERDPQLLAALGQIEKVAGKDDRARKLLTAAVAANTTDAEAYLELARFQLADVPAAGAPNGQLTPAQVSGTIALLRAARKLQPPLPATYELMATTFTRSAEPPKREDVMILIEGVQMFPNRLKLAYETASLSAEAGMIDAAHALADHGLKYAADAVAKARFQELKTSLPPVPAAAATAPAAKPTGAK